jgi:hypothetical protein
MRSNCESSLTRGAAARTSLRSSSFSGPELTPILINLGRHTSRVAAIQRFANSAAVSLHRLRSKTDAAYFFEAAFLAAHRFFRAATMLALPSALSTRFLFAGFALGALG